MTQKYFKYICISLLVMSISAPNVYAARVEPNLTKLHEAVFYGKTNIVEFYSQNGVDINSLAGNDNTPLHMAAFRGEKDSVEILLKYGADATLKNKQGMTALDIAGVKGHQAIADILRKHKNKQ